MVSKNKMLAKGVSVTNQLSIILESKAKQLEEAANLLFLEMRGAYIETHVLDTKDEIAQSMYYPYPALVLFGHCASCQPCRIRVQEAIEEEYRIHYFASGGDESRFERDEANGRGYKEAKKAFEVLCKALP